jgi:D-xylose 1-dehydrogenase (NADP+, D-xylono-1,5-lactone-forming)
MSDQGSRILRWGLLSTARINRLIIPAIRASARSQVTTVASRSRDKAEAYAQEWQIPRVHASYEALLEDPEVDVIYIGLPNSLHVEWTIKSVEAGKYVLCEKPLALSVEDVDRVADAVRRTGCAVAEAFMYRHHPLTHAAQEVIKSGRLGQVRGFKGAFTFPLTRNGDVRLDPSLGGGSLWDVGCYPVSYACLLANEQPADVCGWQQPSPSGVDLEFAGMMRFPDGSVAQFDCGFLGPFRAEMEVIGRDAALRIVRPFRTDHRSQLLLTAGDVTEHLPFPPEDPFAGEIADMEALALDDKAQRIPLAESRRTVAAIVALYRSARDGNAVSLRARP